MPPSVNVAAFVFGIIFVLAALVGQEVEVVAVKLPALPRVTRLIVGVVGIILVYIGLFDPFSKPVGTGTAFGTGTFVTTSTAPSPSPSAAASPAPVASPTPAPTAAPTPTPEPPQSIDDMLRTAHVTLLFYESGEGFPAREQRIYNSRFDHSTARYINWELSLVHLPPQQRLDFVVHAIYYNPDGSIIAEQDLETYIEPEWQSSWHTFGWGWRDPGYWPSGRYTVALFVNGVELTRGSFTIV